MGNHRRPLDVELYALQLVRSDKYRDLLRFLIKQKGPSNMVQIRKEVTGSEKFTGRPYKLIRQLEKAQLVRVRWDGYINWVDATDTAKRLLETRRS